jgi:hypothetical protein
MILRAEASFHLAKQLQAPEGAALGEIFSFISGLYFRGKAVYSTRFGWLPGGLGGGLVITPSEGLKFLHDRVTAGRLREWAAVRVDAKNPAFAEPLVGHCHELVRVLGPDINYVLLGSVATDKYVEPLSRVLREKLLFPTEFVGRGDMSRGALMLRAAREGQELAYAPVVSSVRSRALR